MRGIPTHNFLIFGQTTKPSCLEALQEDSCLPKLMILPGGVQGVSIAQALRMTDAQADFVFFDSNLRHHWVWSWVRFKLTTYKQIMVEDLLSIFTAPDLVLLETVDIEMKYNAHFPLAEKKEEKNNYMYFFHLWQNRFRQSKVLMCLQVPPALFDLKWISTLLVRQRRGHKILPFLEVLMPILGKLSNPMSAVSCSQPLTELTVGHMWKEVNNAMHNAAVVWPLYRKCPRHVCNFVSPVRRYERVCGLLMPGTRYIVTLDKRTWIRLDFRVLWTQWIPYLLAL